MNAPSRIVRLLSLPLAGLLLLPFTANAAPVEVRQVHQGGIPGVVSSMTLPYPAEAVWPIISNPLQLTRHAPNVRRVSLVAQQGKTQDISYSVKSSPLLPPFDYVLRYRQTAPYTLTFNRVSGSFKTIAGYWKVLPDSSGKTCRLVYALNLDPGFAAPKPLIGQVIQLDVPRLMQHAQTQVALLAPAYAQAVAANRR